MLKTERLVAITLLLQARGKMTAERLATIMEVSPRTIYRDINTLSLAHVPIAMDRGPGGGYYLPDDYRLDPTIFTGDEAVALALGGAIAGDYRLFESSDDVRRALVKLEAALPEEYRADVRAARERIFFDTTAWHRRPATTPFLETVRGAVWAGRQLDLLYPRSEGPGNQWRRVEPHGLVCKAGVWYLVAYCHLRKAFRTFRVNRIDDIVVREEKVQLRSGFDLQAYWNEARRRFEEQTAPYELVLRVTREGRHHVRAGSTVQDEQDTADGQTHMRVTVESAETALAFALSLGAEAIVLKPAELRTAVAATARDIAARYGGFQSEAGATALTGSHG